VSSSAHIIKIENGIGQTQDERDHLNYESAMAGASTAPTLPPPEFRIPPLLMSICQYFCAAGSICVRAGVGVAA
jgi:hypothetical protein